LSKTGIFLTLITASTGIEQISVDAVEVRLNLEKNNIHGHRMNKLLVLIILVAVCTGLFAQAGLFNLSYAIPLVEADSLMALSGFAARDTTDNMVRYFPANNDLVEAIIVFVEPKTQRIVGWFIKYNPANTEENDAYVMETLQQIHGEKNHYDEETQQLIWFLSTTRTVHVLYGEDNSLTILYYDAHFSDLFKLKNHPKGVITPEETIKE